MNYPSQSPYTPGGPYTAAGGAQPRRNVALIGGIVVACTALVLGSILLVAFMVNRGGDGGGVATDESPGAEEAADEGQSDDQGGGETASNDPEEVAVSVAKILFGLSDESAEGLVCADPDMFLVDLETTGAAAADTLGSTADLIEDIVASDTTETEEGMSVEVSIVVSGIESRVGDVGLVVEDGAWRACDFAY